MTTNTKNAKREKVLNILRLSGISYSVCNAEITIHRFIDISKLFTSDLMKGVRVTKKFRGCFDKLKPHPVTSFSFKQKIAAKYYRGIKTIRYRLQH